MVPNLHSSYILNNQYSCFKIFFSQEKYVEHEINKKNIIFMCNPKSTAMYWDTYIQIKRRNFNIDVDKNKIKSTITAYIRIYGRQMRYKF